MNEHAVKAMLNTLNKDLAKGAVVRIEYQQQQAICTFPEPEVAFVFFFRPIGAPA